MGFSVVIWALLMTSILADPGDMPIQGSPGSVLRPQDVNGHFMPNGKFELSLSGRTSIRLQLDRVYAVYKFIWKDRPPGNDADGYVFIPEDHQSSIALNVGNDIHPQTEEDLMKMYNGAKVTKKAGLINGVQIEWWHWNDPPHLCSSFKTSLKDSKDVSHLMQVTLVANTPERLDVLEMAFSKIEFF